jgi:hypothetical protein
MLPRAKAFVVWAALAIITAVSVGTAAWMIFDANRSEVAYKQFAKKAADAAAKRSNEDKERSCTPLAAPARAKCEADIDYAAHQAEHDDRDLEAQRTTAIWTRYLGIAGIIGTAFGLLGVALVLFTFREQRKTSRAELRAYISVTLLEMEPQPDDGLIAHIKIMNGGKTPAYKVFQGGDIIVATEDQMLEAMSKHKELPRWGSPKASFTLHAGAEINSDVIPLPFPDRKFSRETLMKVVTGELNLYVYGRVAYEDTFGTAHRTSFGFQQKLASDAPGHIKSIPRSSLAPFNNHST